MRGGMLQNTRTSPACANVWARVSPRPYCSRSNWLESLAEKTLWSNGSRLTKRTVEPTGTTSTRGANSLSLIAISTLTGGAAAPPPARETTAAPRSGDGFPFFSSIATRPVTRGPPCTIAIEAAPTSSAIQRIALRSRLRLRRAAYRRPTQTARRRDWHRTRSYAGSRPFRSRGVNGPRPAMSARAWATCPPVVHRGTPRPPAVFQIVDHPLPERLLPISDGLEPRVQLTYGFIAQVKQIRIEEGQMIVGGRPARHVEAGGASHRVGVVFVLHAQPGAQARIREVGDVPRGIHIRMTGAAELVHQNPVVHRQARLLGQLHRRRDAQSRHQDLGDELAARSGAHHKRPRPPRGRHAQPRPQAPGDGLVPRGGAPHTRPRPPIEPRHPFSHPHRHALL